MKIAICACISVLLSLAVSAQHQLSGRIVAPNQKPVEFAAVSVYPLSDSTLIEGVITNQDGYFNIADLPGDSYQLTVQALGYGDWKQTIELTDNLHLPPVSLKEDVALLGEVVVVARRSVVENHLGKKVLRLGEDLTSAGSNALEALEMMLKSQIQPHILFNSLNNLYHFALKKADEVPELILKLSNVLRYVLYEATDEKVSLAKELAFLKDYVDLQKIQYAGRGQVRYDVQVGRDDETLLIAPFLLIPFIENSFKHSFGTKIREVFVEIDLALREGQLFLSVRNNFEVEVDHQSELTRGGIGLKNVRKRLNLLYPDQHQLIISETEQLYFVTLTIELP